MSDRTHDPYGAFRFVVELDNNEIGGFSGVSGLTRDTTVEEFREGGVNDYVHKLVTVTKYPNLTLKQGMTDRDELWRWHQDVIGGSVRRQTIAVVLRDVAGKEARRWVFDGAYPVRWSTVDLDASSGAVAVETLEFAHHGMRMS
jgi:phage tail-like protein